MKIKVVAPIRYGLEDQSCLPSQMSSRPHELLMWQVSQELKAFVSLRFDAPVLALCVDGFPLHFIYFASKKKWEPRFHLGVCWHAELVVRGSGRHRARGGEQDTRSERHEKF